MTRWLTAGLLASLLALVACSDSTNDGVGGSTATGGAGGIGGSGGGHGGTGTGGTGGQATGGGGGSTGGSGGGTPVTAEALLALTAACNALPGVTPFATDEGEPNTVSICSLQGALFWQADLDIDCDGGQTQTCQNDPAYQPDTSFPDSQGNPLDASALPFVVIPLPSNGFDYTQHQIDGGSVFAVIYNGQLEYGIFGDQGPEGIIGEASYAMAVLLGIDPDPVTGGADSGATYIVFEGPSGAVSANEDHAQAVAIGQARAAELLQNN